MSLNKIWNLDNSYLNLPEIFYSKQNPSSVPSPELVILNDKLAESLGLNSNELRSENSISFLAGNSIAEGSVPIAEAYAAHQFGHFNMLGDGRAVLLGEQITPGGKRFDIQLKGSGKTPYSRRGDGKATLGPMLREYIMSEAMYNLGIPTTRSLAVVTTGEEIFRREIEAGAILTRVADSHIRIGTFQYARNFGTKEDVEKLVDYTLKRHFSYDNESNKALYLLQEVIKRQASLVSKWMLVGFIHGVLNTDNVSISGETIDYGPCAFMDTYDINTVFSSIDTEGRYRYGNQPEITLWNLARFAESILELISTSEEEAIRIAEKELKKFSSYYSEYWVNGMRRKLGLFNEEESDKALIKELLDIMETNEYDYTNTFVNLTLNKIDDYNKDFVKWYDKWQNRLLSQGKSNEEILELMKSNNPAVIPRNHRVEEALDNAKNGDLSYMNNLLSVLSKPFEYSKEQEEYQKLPEKPDCNYQTYCGT